MSLKKAIHIVINDHDFRRLVKGKSLTIHSGENPAIEIALADIGFTAMKEAIEEAELTWALLQAGKDLRIVLT
jgi:hypothetical protein